MPGGAHGRGHSRRAGGPRVAVPMLPRYLQLLGRDLPAQVARAAHHRAAGAGGQVARLSVSEHCHSWQLGSTENVCRYAGAGFIAVIVLVTLAIKTLLLGHPLAGWEGHVPAKQHNMQNQQPRSSLAVACYTQACTITSASQALDLQM
jgi:hypothetical protein